ncbi:hypothetical protein [Streptomyces sp. NBC_00847]|uniref:hypothetical protein n=1 Tax=Streptomyces sp. NBC_00847 TaxID=2975850 RepID=UPI00225B0045|nr:hypothetical protein [Streptomyces sp. NBC_00847]MCX4884821.1 hypothetical protein [Streptomyces sp. NBC_00847]
MAGQPQSAQAGKRGRRREAGHGRGDQFGDRAAVGEAGLFGLGGLAHLVEVIEQEGANLVNADLSGRFPGGDEVVDQALGPLVLDPLHPGGAAAPGHVHGTPATG